MTTYKNQEPDYIQKYLNFIPEQYQQSYQEPDESFWIWNNNKIHIDSKSTKANKKQSS